MATYWYIVGGLLLLLFICGTVGRVKKEMCIDADVYSEHFGEKVECD